MAALPPCMEPRLGLLPPAGRGIVARLAAIGATQAGATVAIALGLDRLFSAALSGRGVPWAGIGLLALLLGAATWLRYRERVDGERLGQGVAHHVRSTLTSHLVRISPTMGGVAPGGVLLRFIHDLTALRNWYARGVVTLFVALPMVVAGLGAVAWLDWRIGAVLALALGGATAAQALLTPGLARAGREARRQRARLASDVVERAGALASIQAFGRAAAEARHMERRSAALAEAMIERARWSGRLRGSAEWIAAGLPLLMLIAWAAGGAADIGAAASAMTVGALMVARTRELGRVLELLTLARISQERIAAFLRRDVLDLRAESRPARRRDGTLQLRRLGIRGGLSGLELKAPAGARVALIGPNGAGKSRLLAILAGLEQPAAGSLVIDGQDMGLRRLSSLRRLVALAGADTPLLRGTVDDNIRYGARARGDEAEEVLALGGYEALVSELPEAGATRLGPGGRGLSVGQQRRVILLRALMRRPLILLLDEIEAGLDAAGEAVLRHVFEAFDGTIVMATHSPAWIARCDTRWALAGPAPVMASKASEEFQHG